MVRRPGPEGDENGERPAPEITVDTAEGLVKNARRHAQGELNDEELAAAQRRLLG